MDTIIYIYADKKTELPHSGESAFFEQTLYRKKEFSLGDYRLIHIGISAELFRICTEDSRKSVNSPEERGKLQAGGAQSGIFGRFWKRRAHIRQEMSRHLVEEVSDREMFFKCVAEEIAKEEDHCCVVCQEAIPSLGRLDFHGYFEEDWVRHMMRYVNSPHFVILGQAACLPQILYSFVRKMKSLKWMMPARQFRPQFQDLVDDFCEEYGLAVDLRLVEEEADYRRCGLLCTIPSVIVDFSEEEKIPATAVAGESVWIDMVSSEEKQRRLEERNLGIAYFSLKKEWKQPQKAVNHLDTISKNGYNT